MAGIIKFPKKNKETDDTQPKVKWSYKDRIRSHKMVIIYRLVLAVVLIAAVTVAAYLQSRNRSYEVCEVLSSQDNHSIRTENQLDLDGYILSYGMDGAACVDSTGAAVWNITYQMQEPLISVQGNMAAIGDYGSRTVYLVNTSGSVGQITTTLPIYKFCISSSGEIAVVLGDTDVTWIYLYNMKGDILAYFKTTMRQSGFPLDLTISPNGKLVGVSFAYVDSGEMRSRVAFYNFGDVGQNETDNYVSGYDYIGVVIPSICFMDNETAYAVADDRIMFYRGAEKPVSVAEHLVSDEIQKVFYDEDNVALVFFSDQAEYRNRIELFDKSGNLVDSRETTMEFRGLIMKDNVVYVYSESRALIFRVGGVTVYDGTLPRSTYLLVPGRRVNRFTTINSATVDMVTLR
ncbi:MAG: hypothetical protein IJ058_11995 [Lachnospiraceae bacterium]|nr:hypothetical protein [Lachnospiraceae bacterium]